MKPWLSNTGLCGHATPYLYIAPAYTAAQVIILVRVYDKYTFHCQENINKL